MRPSFVDALANAIVRKFEAASPAVRRMRRGPPRPQAVLAGAGLAQVASAIAARLAAPAPDELPLDRVEI